jgi:hypothetical protein
VQLLCLVFPLVSDVDLDISNQSAFLEVSVPSGGSISKSPVKKPEQKYGSSTRRQVPPMGVGTSFDGDGNTSTTSQVWVFIPFNACIFKSACFRKALASRKGGYLGPHSRRMTVLQAIYETTIDRSLVVPGSSHMLTSQKQGSLALSRFRNRVPEWVGRRAERHKIETRAFSPDWDLDDCSPTSVLGLGRGLSDANE